MKMKTLAETIVIFIVAFFTFFILISIQKGSAILESGTCTDSDSGLAYEQRGTVTGKMEGSPARGRWSDYCEENILHEFICVSNGKEAATGNDVREERYTCPKRCEEGRCT